MVLMTILQQRTAHVTSLIQMRQLAFHENASQIHNVYVHVLCLLSKQVLVPPTVPHAHPGKNEGQREEHRCVLFNKTSLACRDEARQARLD